MRASGLLKGSSYKLAYQFLIAGVLAKILRQEHCRHLHVHFAHTPAQIAMYASAISGVPFTITAHANDIFERGFLLRQKAERARKMLTISEFNRAFLESKGVPKDKLAVIRCGVSFGIRRRHRQLEPRATYRLGTLGRLIEKKGIDDLIRAVALMSSRPFRVELSVAGEGPLLDELVALAKATGVSDRVSFVGRLGHDHVSDWMGDLDAFVLACKRDSHGDMDGIPVVLMEAMSQSVPVVSTRLTGIPELVIHDKTGLLANADDCLDLAAKIEQLLTSPELCSRLTAEAALHVNSEFGQETNLGRLLAYIDHS